MAGRRVSDAGNRAPLKGGLGFGVTGLVQSVVQGLRELGCLFAIVEALRRHVTFDDAGAAVALGGGFVVSEYGSFGAGRFYFFGRGSSLLGRLRCCCRVFRLLCLRFPRSLNSLR